MFLFSSTYTNVYSPCLFTPFSPQNKQSLLLGFGKFLLRCQPSLSKLFKRKYVVRRSRYGSRNSFIHRLTLLCADNMLAPSRRTTYLNGCNKSSGNYNVSGISCDCFPAKLWKTFLSHSDRLGHLGADARTCKCHAVSEATVRSTLRIGCNTERVCNKKTVSCLSFLHESKLSISTVNSSMWKKKQQNFNRLENMMCNDALTLISVVLKKCARHIFLKFECGISLSSEIIIRKLWHIPSTNTLI